MNALTLGLSALFVAIWGSAFVAAKFAVLDLTPFWALAIRFLITAPLLGGLVVWQRKPWPGRGDRGGVVLMGVFGTAGYLSLTWLALSMTPSGLVALISAAAPLFVALGERFIWKRALPAQAWLGLVLGWVGVGVLGGVRAAESGASAEALGVAFSVLGAASQAAGLLAYAAARGRVDPWAGNAVQTTVGALLLLPLAILLEGAPPSHVGWAAVGGMAWSILVVGILVYVLLFTLLRRLPPATAAALQLLAPPVTALIGWVLLGEAIGPADLLGGAITLAGLALLVRARR